MNFRKLCQLAGSLIIFLAIALLAGIIANPFRLGGGVVGGKVENGRHYVVAKGHRYIEVSQTQWQIEQYLEAAFPWFPVMLLWIGLGLRVAPDGDQQPVPVQKPSAKAALQNFFIALGIFAMTGAMAVVRCLQCGVPWTLGLVLWLALWVAFSFVLWLEARPAAILANES